MADGAIDDWLVTLLSRLAPVERRKVLHDLTLILRRRNTARMTAQEGPDGEPWAPRKPQRDRHGQVRRAGKMMIKLRQVRRLPVRLQGDDAAFGWRGRDRRIAAVHHFGGVDDVVAGREADYPARPLLGIADEDLAVVRERLLAHLAPDG